MNVVFLIVEMGSNPLLEILHSESKIVSDKNAARIHVKILTQAGYHIVFNYVVITENENIKQQEVLKCVVCYYICFFNRISMWACNLYLLLCSSFLIKSLSTIQFILH